MPKFHIIATAILLGTAAVVQPAVPAQGAPPPPVDSSRVAGGGVLRVKVPEAIGGKTVVGQLTVDRALGSGYVTAYGCDDGLPTDSSGAVARSDLNFDGRVSPVASNRLMVKADNDGDLCFYTLRPAAMIIDINAVTFDTGVTSFPNRRTDTRSGPTPRLAAGGVLHVSVPEATGGKTVIGQLTVDRTVDGGFVTAYGCADGIQTDGSGRVARSDLNYDGRVQPIASNRLIVKADHNGDVCFFTLRPAALIIDVNGVSDVGITSFFSRRTDTRSTAGQRIIAGGTLRLSIPEALGAKTVIGQITVDQTLDAGFVTAYGCGDGIPTDAAGNVTRSDLNYNGRVSSVASNRMIVRADSEGEICFYTLRPAALIIDINGVSGAGISSFPNRRVDTRAPAPGDSSTTSRPGDEPPVWPPYTPRPALIGTAALTGRSADAGVTGRPILAVKIDNYSRAWPQWGLDAADAVVELNVEGVTRFIALFHSRLPVQFGPVRSARTADLDILAAMNRPAFAYSGANEGVADWLASAAGSGLIVDLAAVASPCFSRSAAKPGPHNLLLDSSCALAAATSAGAGPATALWAIDARWTPPAGVASQPDTEFAVSLDGVLVEWTWNRMADVYERWQDAEPHVTMAGDRIVAHNVVEFSSVHVPSPADARSPNPITVGTGAAVVHRDGRAIAAIWSRASPYALFEFFDPQTGTPIPLDTGTTFLEITRTT